MEGLSEGAVESQKLTRFLRKRDLQAAYINHLRTRLLHLETAAPSDLSSWAAASGFAPSLGLDFPLSGAAAAEASATAAEALATATAMAADAAAAGASSSSADGGSSSGGNVGGDGVLGGDEHTRIQRAIEALEAGIVEMDDVISRLVEIEGNHLNQYWGYMSRAGFADKSHLMRQIEKYADIYTSRVSNLLPYSPYKQFLCQRQSLAHSTTSYSGRPLMEHWQISDANLGEDHGDFSQIPW